MGREFNITSVKYYRDEDDTKNIGVLVTCGSVKYSCLIDTANRLYNEVLEWVAEGNTIADAD